MNDWNDSIFGCDVEGDLLVAVADDDDDDDDDDDGFESDLFSADGLGLVLESRVDNGTSAVVKGSLVMVFTAILLFSAVE